jgi:hypothetical protein
LYACTIQPSLPGLPIQLPARALCWRRCALNSPQPCPPPPAGITPASHRAAASHARPLSPVPAPCLAPVLAGLLGRLRASFPPVEACLAADKEGCGGHAAASAGAAAAGLARAGGAAAAAAAGPRGAALSLVQRPRLLVCGPEGAGQGHLAPALLHALEGLPIHAIGLPSLLADAGAR